MAGRKAREGETPEKEEQETDRMEREIFEIPLNRKMVERIEAIVSVPEFGFESIAHFLVAAVSSFTRYKESMRARLHRELEESRVVSHPFERQDEEVE